MSLPFSCERFFSLVFSSWSCLERLCFTHPLTVCEVLAQAPIFSPRLTPSPQPFFVPRTSGPTVGRCFCSPTPPGPHGPYEILHSLVSSTELVFIVQNGKADKCNFFLFAQVVFETVEPDISVERGFFLLILSFACFLPPLLSNVCEGGVTMILSASFSFFFPFFFYPSLDCFTGVYEPFCCPPLSIFFFPFLVASSLLILGETVREQNRFSCLSCERLAPHSFLISFSRWGSSPSSPPFSLSSAGAASDPIYCSPRAREAFSPYCGNRFFLPLPPL